MPNPDFADITVVLDRSGSMESVKDDTIGGFNKFLDDQRSAPGRAVLTLAQFDNQYEVVYSARPIGEAPKLDNTTFVPRGWTALLDAIGRTINDTGKRLESMPDHDRPGRVIFVILTDGHENHSKEFTRDKVFQMISHQREVYGWTFLFLGANQDAIGAAAGIGIQAAQAMTYGAVGQGTSDAMAATAAVVRSARLGNVAAYSQADRDKQAQWLASKT